MTPDCAATPARRLARPLALSLLLILAPASVAFAQSELQDRIRARIEAAFSTESMEVADEKVHARRTLQNAYTARGFAPFWVTADGLSERGHSLADWLAAEPRRHGLRPADYHLDPVSELETVDSAAALVDLDLALSDAFLMLASHFLAGRLNPETLDSEWFASRRHRDLVPVIASAATMAHPGDALAQLLPQGGGYSRLVARLAQLRAIRDRGGWPSVAEGPALREGDTGPRVAEMARRLEISGYYDGDADEEFDAGLAEAVVRFQSLHGLAADAVVGRATLRALNEPVQARIDKIVVNLERWRWLPEDLGERYIIVNIAGFNMEVVERGEERLSMRVVVGRPYRRTPVFSGNMTYLVLNPSWEVPNSIAVRDKLPLIKADPAYLSHQGYSLLQGWGADERVVDPASVDWDGITPANFRYRLRQGPGELNALGRVKFMFPNVHAVYLHDTPSRELFAQASRSFSSGCIRLERPLELAELLLSGSDNWRRSDIDRTLQGGVETVVKLRQSIPVHLLYWTAWADEDAIQFRDDIYDRDIRVMRELRKGPPGLEY